MAVYFQLNNRPYSLDVRFFPNEQMAGHVLVIAQRQSKFLYTEKLPIGLEDGMRFSPESVEEAAPQVVRGILYAFIHGLSGSAAFAPFKLMTQENALAQAVSRHFERLGVPIHVEISPQSLCTSVDDCFAARFQSIKANYRFSESESFIIHTPCAVSFGAIQITDRLEYVGSNINKCVHYYLEWKRAEVSNIEELPTEARDRVEEAWDRLPEKPESLVKDKADRGDDKEALDYGLRLRTGFG